MRGAVALLALITIFTSSVTFYTLWQTEDSRTVLVNLFVPTSPFPSPSSSPSSSPSLSPSPTSSSSRRPSPSSAPSSPPPPPPPSSPASSPSSSPSTTTRAGAPAGPAGVGVKKLTPLALAIVFPQFHPIPENDRLWGVNFTEWTLLRPMPRRVIDQIVYKPHPDLGYYNLLDFDHRRFMRVLADQYGIHGFCFYHFWFKDRPVMNLPVERMLKDGEPRKPFVLCWANSNWTRTWQGADNEVILAQDYSDREGNIKHFNHLLTRFRHKFYIRINDRPVFLIYRVDPKEAKAIAGIMELWQELAVEAGLPGIHFMRFNGPYVWADSPTFAGYAQFEPGFSTGYSGQWNAPREKTGRFTGFQLLDTPTLWAAAEQRAFPRVAGLQQFFRGAFLRWSNAPRRNWTNGNYDSYPRIYRNSTIYGFERHLRRVYDLAANDGATITGPEHFVFLTAWNEWNEQSALEPNDIDGYDALMAVKRVFKPHTGKTIVHLGHTGGGTAVFTRDLFKMFPEYNHTWIQDSNLPPPGPDIVLMHIHSVMVREGPHWGILALVKTYRVRKVPILLTIHDYQWLFPENPNPELSVLETVEPDPGNVKNTTELFRAVDKVTFPDRSVYDYYRAKIGEKRWDENTIELVPHSCLLAHSDRYFVAPVENNTINIAFVGQFDGYKGGGLFCSLSGSTALQEKHSPLTLRFHQFGVSSRAWRENCTSPIIFHDKYDNHRLESILQENKIHIITFLSLFPETFSHVLTRLLRAGIPLVYLNRGALTYRLAGVKHTFPVEGHELAGVEAGVSRAVEFVLKRQGTDMTLRELSPHVQPAKWYLLNYPVPAA